MGDTSAVSQELRPCPFCGGEAGMGSGRDGPFVNCIDCLASTNILVPQGQTEAEAVAAWNTRHEHVSGLAEALDIICLNAVLQPDARMGGSTDCYAVPLDDIERARAALAAADGGGDSER